MAKFTVGGLLVVCVGDIKDQNVPDSTIVYDTVLCTVETYWATLLGEPGQKGIWAFTVQKKKHDFLQYSKCC